MSSRCAASSPRSTASTSWHPLRCNVLRKPRIWARSAELLGTACALAPAKAAGWSRGAARRLRFRLAATPAPTPSEPALAAALSGARCERNRHKRGRHERGRRERGGRRRALHEHPPGPCATCAPRLGRDARLHTLSQAVYETLDRDGKGTITAADVRSFMEENGTELSPSDTEYMALIRQYDVDRDGKWSRAEFIRAVRAEGAAGLRGGGNALGSLSSGTLFNTPTHPPTHSLLPSTSPTHLSHSTASRTLRRHSAA